MAIFGKNTARQRLRRATRESLTIPTFRSPLDCTPWVVGGLWPSELASERPDTAAAASCLRTDLQRIVEAANEELNAIRQAVLPASVRQAEESRVIDAARAFAVRRVDSTVRHLQAIAHPDLPELQRGISTETSVATDGADSPARRDARRGRHAAAGIDPLAGIPTGRHAEVEPAMLEADDTTVLTLPGDEVAPARVSAAEQGLIDAVAAPSPSDVKSSAAVGDDRIDIAGVTDPQADIEQMWQLLKFVARQEPGLRWVVGREDDGTIVLVTDLAHGWIPPGITLPAGVQVLEPDRRSGIAATMLTPGGLKVTYTPGDPLGWATGSAGVEASPRARQLPMVDDLGWVLSEATRWRDGLPRMTHTLAKAGAAGTGVLEAEVDVLRVHLDTLRYQILAQYPDVDSALLLNCLLLAATEGIATGDTVAANYHFAWFQRLDTPPASTWTG